MKTNLLFFTKGQKTEKIWYYDLSSVKVGKKAPLTLAHFGFDTQGGVLADEDNAGKPFPSYARMLRHKGTPEEASRCSWTVDFSASRAKVRAKMQPLMEEAAQIKDAVTGLKEQLEQLKKDNASEAQLLSLMTEIAEKDKAARDLETQAADLEAAVFDLTAVNPTAVVEVDTRTPQQIINHIEAQGRVVADALARLNGFMAATS